MRQGSKLKSLDGFDLDKIQRSSVCQITTLGFEDDYGPLVRSSIDIVSMKEHIAYSTFNNRLASSKLQSLTFPKTIISLERISLRDLLNIAKVVTIFFGLELLVQLPIPWMLCAMLT